MKEYKQDNTTIYNADCMEIMSRYEDNYFDLAVVDPPYGININVNMGRRKGDKKSDYHKFAGDDSCIPNKVYFDELKRVSKNQIVWGGNYMTDFLSPSPCWLLWDKGFSVDVTFAQFEMAWTSLKAVQKNMTNTRMTQTEYTQLKNRLDYMILFIPATPKKVKRYSTRILEAEATP